MSESPTITSTPTETPTITETSIETETPTITETMTETVTETPLESPTVTETPLETPTASETPIETETPLETSTETPTPAMTETPTATNAVTETVTQSVTETPTVTETVTETLTGTATETQTPTPSAVPTETIEPLTLALYFYDGQGNLTRAEVNGVVTLYVSRGYVVELDENGDPASTQKYYAFGTQTIAMRTITDTSNDLQWMLSDHLGSTSIVANADGSYFSELRYSAFGEIRFSFNITPTDYRYTGQLSQAEIGLYYYGARWYDPELGRFVQADTIIPSASNPAAWDRYAYVNNNPIRYLDPTGHRLEDGCRTGMDCYRRLHSNQTNLDSHVTLNQYQLMINNNQPGYTACGPTNLARGDENLARRILYAAAGDDTNLQNGMWSLYGMQPSELEAAARIVFGSNNVRVGQGQSLADIQDGLIRGDTVILDIVMVTSTNVTDYEGEGRRFSHFPEVVNVNAITREITLRNTLRIDPINESEILIVSWDDILYAWNDPERLDPDRVQENPETVYHWALFIASEGYKP